MGNEEADSLANYAVLQLMTDHHALTFSEIFTLRKIAANKLWAIPRIHNWYYCRLLATSYVRWFTVYFREKPALLLLFKGNREMQTAFSGFASGHIRCLSFNNKVKVSPTCAKCGLDSASP
ncbi:hypothetical protein CEXT_206611 [Caerostris extrusa]|uniref:RNase H type-1 domain-containing protein n=1 Tax=Caerostris extrusa TaxID=172846 RepID=A0AAV4RTW6_CAEEX|nr:hypothetical protein CEXT_206611 [Caerostris extrusa]